MSLKKTAATVLLVAFCLNVSPTSAMEPATVTLVKAGEPVACIVTAEPPTPSAHLAALELQYHIQKITGAVLPIETDRMETSGTRILVGESQLTQALGITADDFEPLEYLIQIRPDAIVFQYYAYYTSSSNRIDIDPTLFALMDMASQFCRQHRIGFFMARETMAHDWPESVLRASTYAALAHGVKGFIDPPTSQQHQFVVSQLAQGPVPFLQGLPPGERYDYICTHISRFPRHLLYTVHR